VFGKRAENKLRENGRSALATVIAVKQGHLGSGGGQDWGGQNSSLNFHFTLQIAPDGEVPFEAKVNDRILISNSPPGVGAKIAVLYDPNDHSDVRIDHSNEGMVENAIGGIPDSMKQAIQAAGAGDAVADIMKQVATDPEALLKSMRGGGDIAAQFRAQLNPIGAQPAAAAPATQDPVAQLAALADLRDRGVLTNEEFTAQKKRILGE
jgi:Short C-terminal domain